MPVEIGTTARHAGGMSLKNIHVTEPRVRSREAEVGGGSSQKVVCAHPTSQNREE